MEPEKQGFTVMEFVIVVIILAIIAAITVPKFSQASHEARLTDLVSNLQMVRSQMELYKIQHDDLLPGQNVKGGDITDDDFVKAMTRRGSDGMGPYLKKIPANFYLDESGERTSITCVNDINAAPDGTENTGWWLNAATGDFRACDSPTHIAY
jgi:general secretion pathway protein G